MKLTISEVISDVMEVEEQVSVVEISDFDLAVGSVKGLDFLAAGDLIIGTGNGTYTRLAVGATDGHKLTARSTADNGLAWEVESSQEGYGTMQGRLTLTTGTPITVINTSGTVVYLTPYKGNLIGLYDNAAWDLYTLTEISIKATDTQNGNTTDTSAVITGLNDTSQFCVGMEVTGTGIAASSTIASINSGSQVTLNNAATATNTGIALTFKIPIDVPVDIFVYRFSDANKLHMIKWTNTTTRATALTVQDGIDVLTGDAEKRFIGTVMASAAGTVDDSLSYRGLSNAYNQVIRRIYRNNATSHTYNVATIRDWNNSSIHKVTVLTCYTQPIFFMLQVIYMGNGAVAYAYLYDSSSAIIIILKDVGNTITAADSASAGTPQLGADSFTVKEKGNTSTATFSSYTLYGFVFG